MIVPAREDVHSPFGSGTLVLARRLPRPMVFTNGVFDLLHAGHVELIERARRLGESLVVGVNSDASVRTLGKGRGRPITPEHDRIAVVAALRAVSMVLSFDESTPAALLDALRPDVIVKGADYTPQRWPESRQAQAWGARAIVLPLLEGRSTTATVARIRAGVER